MSDHADRFRQSLDSLQKMLEVIGPYMPAREFEGDPPRRTWESKPSAESLVTPRASVSEHDDEQFERVAYVY